jgi:hypothetical protein
MKAKKTGKRVWRVICVLGDGHVFGNCGHAHPTLTRAMCCTYAPRAYRLDREALLLARPLTA